MFSWSIAKSAEGMFSRWAIKRVFKFLLKKKLGKFILGDIDLNQLDVQLSAGTIQLSDLALNVDYINQKLGAAGVMVKEGSIGSLLVTMPWKDGGCQIEVDELEIVLAPRSAKVSDNEFVTASNCNKDSNSFSRHSSKVENESINSGVANASVDVHEGVKTIAKMVKWLLTSFHVKIRKLIVAFDPLVEEESENRLDRILVLRISEAECGTNISEDASPSKFSTAHNILGLSQLTSFVKFQGAVLELLHVDGLESQPNHSTETALGNWFPGCCSSGNMTTIIAGEKGGVSGNLRCSIPWKNGSLDVRRVDADLYVEPLELRLQPSSIRCFILMWDLFIALHEQRKDLCHGSSDGLSAPSSWTFPSDKELFRNEGPVTNYSLVEKEPANVLLSESHLISDWVSRSHKDGNEEVPDFGASVDQFFECFDELRNSQSTLGNSGMWNWTCSVFTAITAASDLASGSLLVPAEQQHVETKFNATIAKASLLLTFIDDNQKQSQEMKGDEANYSDIFTHCVCAQFVDLLLVVQVRPQEINFEGNVHHVQVVDHLCSKSDLVQFREYGCSSDSGRDIALACQMQDGVQGALRTFKECRKDRGIDLQVNYPVDISLSSQEDISRCCHMINGEGYCWKDSSVTLLKTSGLSWCQVVLNSSSSGCSLMGPTSISLKMPPFVCWVNFDLITMILELLNEMTKFVQTTRLASNLSQDSDTKRYGLSPVDSRKMDPLPGATLFSAKASLEINVFLPNVRIFLCFPLKERNDFCSYSSCNQVIAFDFISPCGEQEVQYAKPTAISNSNNRISVAASCSLHLNLGDFYLFSISAVLAQEIVGIKSSRRQDTSFSVEEIISAVTETSHLYRISMSWLDGPVTDPSIAMKAKGLVSSEKVHSEDKFGERGCEFASVTIINDIADFDGLTRQEILSSSAFLLHAQLPPVKISLDKWQYENLSDLLNQVLENFTCDVSDSCITKEEQSASQASMLVECDSVTITVSFEPMGDGKCSMMKELPGPWLSATLEVGKFELLSVTNIGGIRTANFFSVAHGQGNLWGSVTEGVHREFLLISCSGTTLGRGDGEGSNVLSSRSSGSNIVNFWDPESNHNFTSITVKGGTIVAIGGRLDWFNSILSFFSQRSSELEPPVNSRQEKTCGSSFILNLVDVGLSYEPHFKSEASKCLDPKLLDSGGATHELYVGCLLAASSLKLYNTCMVDCTVGEYKIKMQDLGLLICPLSETKSVGSTYSVEHLRKIGYVKVAQEAHVEMFLKTNCKNGHVWELECPESHIALNTCHDSTLGLTRLIAQLQDLFAPDMRDYVAHLENRWNSVQHVHGNSHGKTLGGEVPASVSQLQNPNLDKKAKVGGLMDEIYEDVFLLDENSDGHGEILESCMHVVAGDSLLSASGDSSSVENVPEFMEEYFLSDLRPLSELALGSHSPDTFYCNNRVLGENRMGSGWYGDNPLNILENHASKVDGQRNVWKPVAAEASTSDSIYEDVGKAAGCIHLKNMNVIWRMYGGSDWSNTHDTSETSARTCGRDATSCLELVFSGIEVGYDIYPDTEIFASKLSLSIRDFFLNDRSDHAPWKLVLGYHHSKKNPRKFSSNAINLNLEAVKPDPSVPLEENRLRVSLLPMRLHLHQSQLDFLIGFFGGSGSSADPSPSIPLGLGKEPSETNGNLQGTICEEAFLPFFQKFDICSMVIRVDYSPCRVDLTALRGGKYVELVNLVPWKGVELQLKHVQGMGLYGWNSICEAVLGEWLEDISQNQIHKLLKGLPPIKSLVAVGSGAAKLVSLPVKNYKKDQKLLKGMQRGTFAFLRSISLEAIGLGVHLAAGAHDILLQAEYILASIPPSVPWPVESRLATNVRSNQPKGAHQGIKQACQSIGDGLGKSASALVQIPLKKYQRGAGMGSALATAVQSAPAAAIAPASAAARAVHCALLGFRNSLDPEHRRESMEKYSGRIPPHESMQ